MGARARACVFVCVASGEFNIFGRLSRTNRFEREILNTRRVKWDGESEIVNGGITEIISGKNREGESLFSWERGAGAGEGQRKER